MAPKTIVSKWRGQGASAKDKGKVGWGASSGQGKGASAKVPSQRKGKEKGKNRVSQGASSPNLDDPLEVARNTNEVARATSLLAEVPMIPLKGSIAKTHLLSFLHCLKAGNVYWSDTKKLMVPPAAQATLLEHLEHGMHFEVFSYKAVQEDKAAMVALCQADNFDAAFALGETEVSLLRCIHAGIAVARPPVGRSQWDCVKETAAVSCGRPWEDVDMIAVYNFAKAIGVEQLDLLCNIVAIHVPLGQVGREAN